MIAMAHKKRKLRQETDDSNDILHQRKSHIRPLQPASQNSTAHLLSSFSFNNHATTTTTTTAKPRRSNPSDATKSIKPSKSRRQRQPPPPVREPEIMNERQSLIAPIIVVDDADAVVNKDDDINDDNNERVTSPQKSSFVSKNLFHQLVNRSMLGNMQQFGGGHRRRRQPHHTQIRPPLPNWKRVTTVELNTDMAATTNGQRRQVQYGTMASRAKIDHLAWDASGMLLATTSASTSMSSSNQNIISIFDWDVVMASFMQATSHSSRSSSQSSNTDDDDDPNNPSRRNIVGRLIHSVPPIVQFPVPHPIAAIQWNPSDPDMLAVAFRTVSHVHIYDVAKVAEAQSNTSQASNHNTHRSPPSLPRSCYIVVGMNQNHCVKNISCMKFLDRYHIVLAHELGQLSCWKIPSLNKKQTAASAPATARLIWRHVVANSIQCLAILSCDCLVVGDRCGTMTFVLWKCCVRAAFSSEPSPKILAQWSTSRSLSKTLIQPHQRAAGQLSIQQIISLDDDDTNRKTPSSSSSSSSSSSRSPQSPRLSACRLLWITQGGWVLEASLRDWNDLQSTCPITIHHRPPLVQYQKWDGTAVSVTTDQGRSSNTLYSTLQVPVQSVIDHTKSIMAWTKVPATTLTLPHHDRMVVTGSVSSLQCQRREEYGIWVGWISNEALPLSSSSPTTTSTTCSWRIQEIPWPGSSTPPRVFAMHPSGEWLVVSKGDSMVLVKAFGKK